MPTETAKPENPATRPGRGWLVGTAVAAGVLVAAGTFGFQELRLAYNLRRAREHAPIVRQHLEGDNRFLGVSVKESPSLYGSLRVGGFVLTEDAATRLREAIDDTRPPVVLDWQVRILGAAAVGEALSKIAAPATVPATIPSN